MAYEQVEPDGPVRRDYRAGILWAKVTNALLPRGSAAAHWHDMFPEHDPTRDRARTQTPREAWVRLESLARSHGLIPPKSKTKKGAKR